MIITFYKNCILNDSYAEVVDVFQVDENGKTGLDRYLESLAQKQINLENVYLTEEGKLSFQIEDDIDLSYNYMKLKDDLFTRYCFIDDMQIINSLLLVNYSLDVWSTYANKSHIRNSLLTRSYVLGYSETGGKILRNKLPVNFISSRKPKIQCISRNDVSSDPEVYAVVTIQAYKTGQSGETTYRTVITGIIKDFPDPQLGHLYFSYNQINLEYLMQLMIFESGSTFDNGLYDDLKYEITNFYILPKEFFISFGTNEVVGTIKLNVGENNILNIPIVYINDAGFGKLIDENIFSLKFINDSDEDTKIRRHRFLSVGTFSSQFKVDTTYQNAFGTPNIVITIAYSWDNLSFKLFLGLNGNYYEVTKDFELDFPIDVEKASVTQLKGITRAINNNKLDLERGRTMFNTVGSMSKSYMKGGGQIGTALSITSDFGNGVVDLMKIANDEELLNNESNTSNNSSETFNVPSLNVYMGICQRYISNTLNDDQVVMMVNNTGYIVNEFVNDILYNINYENKNYDIVRFGFINLYGDFSQSIMKRLKSILLNGVRIWKDVI